MKKLSAGVRLDANGLAQSINAMQLEMNILGVYSKNIVGFDKVGYQKKDAVVSSFAEFIGPNAMSECIDDQVGRLTMTNKPLDIALSEKGYFQVLNKDGSIELTRDGRFKLDKDGYLLTTSGQKVLSAGGRSIKLNEMPDTPDKLKIGLDGKIQIFDEKERKFTPIAKIGIVNSDGSLLSSINFVRQGYVESSNVQLETEMVDIINYRRSFDANKQMFKIQNNNLSNAIQKLTQG